MHKISDILAEETVLKEESLKNLIIDTINIWGHIRNDRPKNITIIGCDIKTLSLTRGTFGHILIDNCKIGDLSFMGVYVPNGLVIKNCHFMDEASFESGGYNLENSEIIIKNNVFEKGLTFCDSVFKGPFHLLNNHFKGGTDILYKNQLEPSFNVPPIIEGNKGDLKKQIIPE